MSKNHHLNLHFSIRGAYFLKKKVRSLVLRDFGRIFYVLLSFTGQQYKLIRPLSANQYSHNKATFFELTKFNWGG